MHTAEMDKLGELQTKLDALRAHRATWERQKAQLNDTLESIIARRAPLTRALAKGDATAAKRLDDLDFEERSIRRSLEGVQGNLDANLAEIQLIEPEYLKESQAAGAKKRAEEYQALKARGDSREKLIRETALKLIALLVEQHADARDICDKYPDQNGSHDATRWTESLNVCFHLGNKGWTDTRKTFGQNVVIQIRPLVPPR